MDFERMFDDAVAARVVPGVVLLAESTSGAFHYEKVAGLCSLEAGREQPLQRDTVFMLMSVTKIVTAVLALQLVDRGHCGLDDDVLPLLPELAALPVLAGFDGDVPRLHARTAPITLRQLLTHASGVAYDFLSTDLARYHAWLRTQPDRPPPPRMSVAPPSVEDRFRYPLVFQPGAGWAYGAGLDWVGRFVERLTAKVQGRSDPEVGPDGSRKLPSVPLETILASEVLAPLGLAAGALTFHPERYPAVFRRLWPSLPARPGNDPSRHAQPVAHAPSMYRRAPAALGGQGLWGDMPSVLQVLLALLRDDGRLLSTDASALVFAPLLADMDAARADLLRNTENPAWITGDVPDTKEYDWSAGGLLVTGDAHPVRRKGAVLWCGAVNLTFVIDRQARLACLFGSNYNPPGDVQGKSLMRQWEAFVYHKARASGCSL